MEGRQELSLGWRFKISRRLRRSDWKGAKRLLQDGFQEQKVAEAVVVSGVSVVKWPELQGQDQYQWARVVRGSGPRPNRDQDQGAFCSGKAIIDWRVGNHHW